MKSFTVGSLFSGIGGLDLGLERAGMEVRWQVEIDPFCQKVLAKHWPEVKRYGDIKTLTGLELEPVDLICGGFPCQPVSVAGKRRGTADDRWLWPEYARLLRVVRPRYALIENVPGLLRLGMGEVLRDLATIGYDAEWQTIPAAAFGAPHLRYRVFIVAFANILRLEEYGSYDTGLPKRPSKTRTGQEQQEIVAYTTQQGRSYFQGKCTNAEAYGCEKSWADGWWDVEPNVGRVADGVPQRVDRLRALGNAVVPQVAEWIGRRIMAVAS